MCKNYAYKTYGPLCENSVLFALLSNKGSDKSAHVCRLVRAFTAQIHIVCMVMKTQTKI